MTTESVRMFSSCTQTFMNANAIRHRCVVHRESVISMRFVRELICKRTQLPKIIWKTHIKRKEIENKRTLLINIVIFRPWEMRIKLRFSQTSSASRIHRISLVYLLHKKRGKITDLYTVKKLYLNWHDINVNLINATFFSSDKKHRN